MSSKSIPTINMLESIALAAPVVSEENDFVMVEEDDALEDAMMMVGDDDSYDYCEDVVSMRSPSPSLTVDTDLPSIDPASFGLEPSPMEGKAEEEEKKSERRPRVISFGNEEDEEQTRTGRFESDEDAIDELMDEEMERETPGLASEGWNPRPVIGEEVEESTITQAESKVQETMSHPKSAGSRRSNKKRRKELKRMRKEAAAQAAAEALSEMQAARREAASVRETKARAKKSARSQKYANLAVACATDALEAYRREVQGKKKGNCYVSPL